MNKKKTNFDNEFYRNFDAARARKQADDYANLMKELEISLKMINNLSQSGHYGHTFYNT